MSLSIRPETPADYHRIAELNALGFAYFLEQPLTRTFIVEFALVDALRHTLNFDPQLSLVAELDGKLVAHVLLLPCRVHVGGQPLRALMLGPIVVDPGLQKTGLGGQLIEHAHARARALGYDFVFLLGHPSYYPRFGYQTDMFGECRLAVRRAALPALEVELAERLPQPGDLPLLLAWWRRWFAGVDLAWEPDASLLDWISHTGNILGTVLTLGDETVGYVRYNKNNPGDVKLFLARDGWIAVQMLAYLAAKAAPADGSELAEISLPLHPSASALGELLPVAFEVRQRAYKAAMIYILNEACSPIRQYCAEVAAGTRPPGLLVYPPAIEIAA